MGLFIIGTLIALAALAVGLFGKFVIPSKLGRVVATVVLAAIGFIAIVWSTTLYVEDNQGGLVVKKFGDPLPAGSIVSVNGEAGPQAKVLSPGWHFWYAPWVYDLTPIDNIDIPQGQIGLVTAKDGKPMPDGNIYAPEWESPQKMLDAEVFLKGEGVRGPQLTVLKPGQYRYNPRLFVITTVPALNVPVGSVAVVKANAGPVYEPTESNGVEVVNGVPIVPRGYRGIWKEALTPNQYYLHPQAYEVTFVKTTKRVYSYTKVTVTKADRANDNSIGVRTSDGYKFPVDVRVSVKVSAENAPYVVAMLGDPDGDADKDGFDVLEEKAILPSIRSIFRNSAEKAKGLQYVSSRSKVEADSTTKFTTDMTEYKVDVDKVYVADIRLDDTEEGKALLKTQTDRELAQQQQETYVQQVEAEKKRAEQVAAAEEATRKKDIAAAEALDLAAEYQANAAEKKADGEARAAIKSAEGQAAAVERVAAAEAKAVELKAAAEAKARELMAAADAEYNAKMVESLGGVENYTRLKLVSELFTAWQEGGAVPQISVSGSEGGSVDVILAKLMQQMATGVAAPASR